MQLNIGDKAPEFALPNQDNKIIKLSDYLGKKVVVYFYPKDNTPGCTRQAKSFADAFSALQEKGVVVLGISKDTTSSHEKFACKYELPFNLLSDTGLDTIKAYGVWKEKSLYGKTFLGIERSCFLVDEKGNLLKIWHKVKPDTNGQEVLNFIN